MDEKKQPTETRSLKREDVTELAEATTTKPTPATRQETREGACECPPGCVGLPCCK